MLSLATKPYWFRRNYECLRPDSLTSISIHSYSDGSFLRQSSFSANFFPTCVISFLFFEVAFGVGCFFSSLFLIFLGFDLGEFVFELLIDFVPFFFKSCCCCLPLFVGTAAGFRRPLEGFSSFCCCFSLAKF